MLAAAACQAQIVLFTDNFTSGGWTSDKYDINYQYNQGRQTGQFAPKLWTERPETAVGGAFYMITLLDHPWGDGLMFFINPIHGSDAGFYSWAAPNCNFNVAGEMTIEARVNPLFLNASQVNGTDDNHCAVMIFGTDVPGTYKTPSVSAFGVATSPSGGMAFTLTDAGLWKVYEDSGEIATGVLANPKPGAGNWYLVDIKITTAGYGNGSPADVAITVDGVQIFTYTRTQGFANNYISLAAECSGSDNAYRGSAFEDFKVTLPADTVKPTTTANLPGRLYRGGQNVELAADEPATIYYTTDGSTPTTGSTVYSGPISINESTVLKFFAVDTAGNVEAPKHELYTIIGPELDVFTEVFEIDRQNEADINYALATRQGGNLPTVPWTERTATASGGTEDTATMLWHSTGDQDLDFFATGASGGDARAYVWGSPEHNFTESGAVTVQVYMNPLGQGSTGSAGDHFAALVFGTEVPGTYVASKSGTYGTAVSPSGGMAVTITDGGAYKVYSDDAVVAQGTVASPKPGADGWYLVKVDINAPAFNGSAASVTCSINGQQVYSGSRPAGFHGNYVTLGALGIGASGYQSAIFDNLSVTMPVDLLPPFTRANPPGGRYREAQYVTLTANEPATIHYTVDGTEPTTSSAAYSGPIPVYETTTLKFFAVDNSGNAEAVQTELYKIERLTPVFYDSFNTIDQVLPDINTQYDDGVRQTGLLAPIALTERPETMLTGTYDGGTILNHYYGKFDLDLFASGQPDEGGNPAPDYMKYIWAAPDHNFVDYGRVVVEADVDPLGWGSTGGDDTNHFAAIIVGTDVPGTYVTPMTGEYSTAVSLSGGVAFTLTDAGTWTVFEDTGMLATGTVAHPKPGGGEATRYHVEIDMDNAAFDGSPAPMTFMVDGETVYSYTRQAGFTNNYVTMSALGIGESGYQWSAFENLHISTAVDLIGPDVSCSPPPGLYGNGVSVTLTANERGTIYYTTDGSEPTTGSRVYTGPIAINTTTTLKFFAVDLAGNESTKKEATYIVPRGALLTDNLDPGDDAYHSNINDGIDSTDRQTGSLAPLAWTERPETADPDSDYRNQTIIHHPWSANRDLEFFCNGSFGVDYATYIWAAPDHNFTDTPRLIIECDVDPLAPSSSPAGHNAGIIFGTEVPGTYLNPNTGLYGTAMSPSGVSFTIDNDGNWGVNEDWMVAADVVPAHAGFYHLKISIDTPAYDGSPAVLTFWVDGQQVYSYTKDPGFTSNYITLAGETFGSEGYQLIFWDNFIVRNANVVTAVATIKEAKSLQDGEVISIDGKALYMKKTGFGYIEETDRTNGIRIEGTITANQDDLVNVVGTLKTKAGGERYIEVSSVTPGGTESVRTVGTTNKALRDTILDGLYVTAWGSVKAGSITANSFVISDGSDDGIKVVTEGAPGVSAGQYVSVRGAAGTDTDGSRVVYRK